jgi:hypothetical protein
MTIMAPISFGVIRVAWQDGLVGFFRVHPIRVYGTCIVSDFRGLHRAAFSIRYGWEKHSRATSKRRSKGGGLDRHHL